MLKQFKKLFLNATRVKFSPETQNLLTSASVKAKARTANTGFRCHLGMGDYDRFTEYWANVAYQFVAQVYAGYDVEPLREIGAVDDADHTSGANASFQPSSGKICLCPSYVAGRPGRVLEKLTHELTHAALDGFPAGDPFYEEGYTDFSVWVLAHAPVWGEYRRAMIESAEENITLRRERALRDLSDYDRKRWAGGVFAAEMHGPMLPIKLRMRKLEGTRYW